MSAAQLKTEIHEYLDAVKDETFLKVVHSMLNTYVQENQIIVGYRPNNQSITQDELIEELLASEAAIERGEFLTIDQLIEESEKW
jgi:hypothetical protein